MILQKLSQMDFYDNITFYTAILLKNKFTYKCVCKIYIYKISS